MAAWQVLPMLSTAATAGAHSAWSFIMLKQHFSSAFPALWKAGPWGSALNVIH